MRCIDADALIHELKNSHYPGEPDVNAGIGIAIGKVWDAPTIESERKKGKWFWGDGMYSCDQCHAAFYETSPFCPMCGADMRGEHE